TAASTPTQSCRRDPRPARLGRCQRRSRGHPRGREPGALIEGIHRKAHKELDVLGNPELPWAGAVAGGEKHTLVDQHPATVRTTADRVPAVVDHGGRPLLRPVAINVATTPMLSAQRPLEAAIRTNVRIGAMAICAG